MTLRSKVAAASLAASLLVAAPAMAQVGDAGTCNVGFGYPPPEDAGVCYSLVSTSSSSSCLQDDLAPFCYNLRNGVQSLNNGKGLQALAAISAAAEAAARIRDDRRRRYALDEARGARAVVLATLGDDVGARALLEQQPAAPLDTLALLKAAFYGRQNELDKAAQSFEAARRELPDRWCDGLQRTYDLVKKGVTPGIDATLKRDMSQWHYLPSYFSHIGDANCVTKAYVDRPPLETAVHIYFESGQWKWDNRPENRASLNRILDAVGRDAAARRNGVAWQVVGHTDQQCPTLKKEPEKCRASNQILSQQRAETVRARVLQALNYPNIGLTALGVGMSSPIVDAGYDQAHPLNRRAVLLPSAAGASTVTAEECPWNVRIKGGAMDGVAIQPNAPPLRVGRNAWYEIVYNPPKGGKWTHFSAIRELSDSAKEDIAPDGGLRATEIRKLAEAGGRLPLDRNRYYRVDPRQDTEAIVLSVAEAPIPASIFLSQFGAGKPIQVASADGLKLYMTEDLLRPKTKGPSGRMEEGLGRELKIVPRDHAPPVAAQPGSPSPRVDAAPPPGPSAPQARIVPSPPPAQTEVHSCRFMLSLL